MPRRDRTVMVIENDPDCLEAGPAPDLILLDLMLPVMDGGQFLVEQRSRPGLAQIPIALLSGERDLQRRASELAPLTRSARG